MNEIKKQRILKNLRTATAEMSKIQLLWKDLFSKANKSEKKVA